MGISVQQRAQALGPGADLWIVPEKSSCDLVRKVDWYLGFKIEKAEHHDVQELSPELQDRLRSEGLVATREPVSKSEPLMVLSGGALPAEIIVSLHKGKQLSSWIKKCEQIWTDLGRPKVRVFLPDGATIDEFRSEWKDFNDPHEVHVVVSV